MNMWTAGYHIESKNLIPLARAELQMSQKTAHRIYQKCPHLKPHKLHVVQKLKAQSSSFKGTQLKTN